MIIVEAEEDHAIYKSPSQQIHSVLDSLGYREYQIFNASYVGEGSSILKPMIPKASIMMAKQMKMQGYQHGKGLGCNLQGITKPVKAEGNSFHFGLGYKPSRQDYQELIEKKELAREGISIPLDIPPIQTTFSAAKEVIGGLVSVTTENDLPEEDPAVEELALNELFIDMIETDGMPGSHMIPVNAKPSKWNSFPLLTRRSFV